MDEVAQNTATEKRFKAIEAKLNLFELRQSGADATTDKRIRRLEQDKFARDMRQH